jgi:Mce-associated membrane protein
MTDAFAPSPARNPLTLAGVVLVAMAAICAVVFGLLWLFASPSLNSDNGFSQTRQTVLDAAEQGAINFTTLDYHNVQQGLNQWKQSATGPLLDQLNQGTSSFVQQVQQAKATTSGKLRDGAVTELDPRAGKATVLVIVDVTVTPAGGKPTTKRLPLLATLNQTSAGWKLSALGQVPVGTAGQ